MPKENRNNREEERVLREYPNSTRLLVDNQVEAVGNLVLSTRRLVFINAIDPSPEMLEKMREMGKGSVSKSLDFVLTLHKDNFQIPLERVTKAKISGFISLPVPRYSLRVEYLDKNSNPRSATFQFTIALIQGFFKFEMGIVWSWIMAINRARSTLNE